MDFILCYSRRAVSAVVPHVLEVYDLAVLGEDDGLADLAHPGHLGGSAVVLHHHRVGRGVLLCHLLPASASWNKIMSLCPGVRKQLFTLLTPYPSVLRWRGCVPDGKALKAKAYRQRLKGTGQLQRLIGNAL